MQLDEVRDYYRARVLEHGPQASGVDWNSEESQVMRFEQLIRLFPRREGGCSVLDFGCGYGAMYPFLQQSFQCKSYCGFDIVPEMLEAGRARYPSAEWRSELPREKAFDYAFASGVFNVRLSQSDAEWKKYLLETIQLLASVSRQGFAFNVLSTYSDPPKRKSYLHYADPLEVFDFCKRQISPFASLLHDYPLYEFTIAVRME